MPRYVVAAVLSRIADEGARVGLILLAVERTGSAALGGVLVAALLVPQVVAAPLVGRAVDRAARPARTLAVLVAGFSVCLGLASAVVGRVSVVVVVVVLVAGGAMAPSVTGGLSGRLGSLVGRRRAARAFGVDSVVYNVCGVAGPAAVGVLAVRGAGLPMTALAVGGVAGSVAVWFLPMAPSRGAVEDRTAGPGHSAAWSVMRRDRPLAAVTAASCLAQVGLGALGVVVTMVASRQGTVETAGLVLAALPVGALLGSLGWIWRPASVEQAPGLAMWAQVAVGVPMALTAWAPNLATVATLLALSGVALGPATGAVFLTRERRTPAALRGQVFALGAGVKLASGAAGAALAGFVAGLESGVLLLSCGALPVLAALIGVAILRTRDRHESVAA